MTELERNKLYYTLIRDKQLSAAQRSIIKQGIERELPSAGLNLIANNKYDADQMNVLLEYFSKVRLQDHGELTRLMLNANIPAEIMKQMYLGASAGLLDHYIISYARDENYDLGQMEQIRLALQDDSLPDEVIDLIAEPQNSAGCMKLIHRLINKEVPYEMIEHYKPLSEELLEPVAEALELGLEQDYIDFALYWCHEDIHMLELVLHSFAEGVSRDEISFLLLSPSITLQKMQYLLPHLTERHDPVFLYQLSLLKEETLDRMISKAPDFVDSFYQDYKEKGILEMLIEKLPSLQCLDILYENTLIDTVQTAFAKEEDLESYCKACQRVSCNENVMDDSVVAYCTDTLKKEWRVSVEERESTIAMLLQLDDLKAAFTKMKILNFDCELGCVEAAYGEARVYLQEKKEGSYRIDHICMKLGQQELTIKADDIRSCVKRERELQSLLPIRKDRRLLEEGRSF